MSALVGAVGPAVAAFATAGALAALARAAARLGLVDAPDARHAHARPTPRIGGLAAAAGAAAGVGAAIAAGACSAALPARALLGAAILLVAGALDDRLRERMPALAKLAAQIAAAAIVAAPFGPGWGLAVGVLLVAACNAFNFLDHADGLLGLALLPGALAYGLGSAAPGLATPLAAAIVVMLVASLRGVAFAGDAGSQSLGFLAAAAPFAGALHDEPALRLAGAAHWTALPLLDLALVCAIRVAGGVPPWRATHDHLADRYAAAGRGPRAAVAGVAIWSASTIALGYAAFGLAPWQAALASAAVAVAVVSAGAPPARRSR